MSGKMRRPSPAMVVAMAALFISLSGVSYAALKANSIGAKELAKNSVRSGEIKNNAVGAKDLGDNSVGSGEVANEALGSADVNGLGGGDISDGALTGADIQDESLGGGEITDGALTGGDVQDGSLGTADAANLDNEVMGIGESVSAFGRVQASGTLLPATDPTLPSWAEGIDQSDISRPGGSPGVYCFDSLDFRPVTGMVSLDNAQASGDNNFAVSLAIERGNNIGPCAPGSDARVITTRINDGAAPENENVDHPFLIWFIR